jgi:regulator of sirC expression with transglutaminase-like and TPR domain
MFRRCSFVILLALSSLALSHVMAQDEPQKKIEKKTPAKKANAKGKSVEELTEYAKQSIVVILYTGREGKQQGLGTGFVISNDGLVATNLHVIGDGRPISVLLPDGTKKEATAVHASDRSLDLAIIKVDTNGMKPLPLGDSKSLRDGQPLVAIGHPQGLKYSVVAGVLSGRREVEAIPMLQIAMPVEPGNSGGPVLDMEGKVIGVVTMKSLVTNNLGFAVPIASLEKLIKRPNPIPIENWVTLGALDKSEWQPVYGGRWQQRSGRIIADGTGTGFGGRTLCFWQRGVPSKMPYEIGVNVKLDDESGAAGLIFGGEGEDRHYGFYPTNGKLRLTRFNGADVYSWKILRDEPSKHYRAGEWNHLKVRVEKDRVRCFVNGEQVYELESPEYFGKALGLAKFRQTVAEYKKFQVGVNLSQGATPTAVLEQLKKSIAALPELQAPSVKQFDPLLKSPMASMSLLRERAQQLEKQATELRKLATRVHHEGCLRELTHAVQGDDAKIDLLRAGLLIAKIDNEELDVEAYLKEVDRLAKEVQATFPKNADEEQRLEALTKYMFEQRGFHGSRADYYSRSNSYLNEVIDDREGLPITLSVLYLELAARLKLKVVGVALPGHFVVRFEPAKGPSRLIDVYEGGRVMSEQEAQRKVLNITGNPLRNKDLNAVTKKAILVRMLHNLVSLAERDKDIEGVLRYLDGILAVDAAAHDERWVRAVFRFQSNRKDEALEDCEYLLANVRNPNVDLDRVREMKRLIEEGRDK